MFVGAFAIQGCQMVYVISNQISKFGLISEGLAMEDVDVFFGYSVYFKVIKFALWSFVHFVVIWCIFPVSVGMLYLEKSGTPDLQH
jgi:hypothetical protein